MQMKPLSTGISELDQPAKAATGPENSENEEGKGGGAPLSATNQDHHNHMTQHETKGGRGGAAGQEEKGSEEDSDVESMMREMDPVKRHIKQLRLKKKQMEKNRPKRMANLPF